MAVADDIKKTVESHRVVVYMKGTKIFPQCGFSANTVAIFKQLDVPIETVNVLADPAVREGIKAFTSWPTIPQIFIDGKFVGGNDILKEMYASGELKKLLGIA